MPKQNNELAQRVEPVHAELILSPAIQSQTLVDRGAVEEMVARQVAEMLTKSETAIFEPFFRSRQVAYALRGFKASLNSAFMPFAMNRRDAWCAPAETLRTVSLVCAPAAIPASFRLGRASFES